MLAAMLAALARLLRLLARLLLSTALLLLAGLLAPALLLAPWPGRGLFCCCWFGF